MCDSAIHILNMFDTCVGPRAQQKAQKRGKEERSEQAIEEGPRSAQQCSLQRGGAQGGRAEEAKGWQSLHFITKLQHHRQI